MGTMRNAYDTWYVFSLKKKKETVICTTYVEVEMTNASVVKLFESN